MKITPQFAVRAGANWRTSPMKRSLEGAFEVFPAGTVAHYTLDKGTISYSVGLDIVSLLTFIWIWPVYIANIRKMLIRFLKLL